MQFRNSPRGGSCGVGIVLLPLVGYFTLWGMLELTPQFITTPYDGFLAVLAMGTVIGLAMVPTKRRPQPAQPQGPTVSD